MAKDYKCPACQNAVDRGATICSNPECRKDLAFCSHCRDVTTYTLVDKAQGRFGRDKFRCTRCERIGARCVTWAAGGYCNGLTRESSRLCASCHERIGEVGRTVVAWSVIGALGGLIKRK